MSKIRSLWTSVGTPAFALGLATSLTAQVIVKDEQKISATQGGFGGSIGAFEAWGSAVAELGDVDGDGIGDVAVSEPFDGLANFVQKGAVWVLFLEADGTVRDEQKIGALVGGFGDLGSADRFGTSVAGLGDLDGDGIGDLAVGATGDNDGAPRAGAVWILFLNPDGTVRQHQKISLTEGGFGGTLGLDYRFGGALATLGDLDGDGVTDLAVGVKDPEGVVWILFLNPDGTVKTETRTVLGTVAIHIGGVSPMGPVGDLDGDSLPEIAVANPEDDTGAINAGAVELLSLAADGSLRWRRTIDASTPAMAGLLEIEDGFGGSMRGIGDLDGNGVVDLVVGTPRDDDGGPVDRGCLYFLFLESDGAVRAVQKVSATHGAFDGTLLPGDLFGASVAPVGDLDGNGIVDLVVGAPQTDDGYTGQGAVWVLFLEPGECVTLDFETEDDLVTPLVNGQHLDMEFGTRVDLASSGPNAGLAIFDSTPGGPNGVSQDPDLLVNTGNLLILQTENLPPDASDVFPRPNDDEDGGTIAFAFHSPVEPRSVRLIDVDATDGDSLVTLTDVANARRVFTVPAGWTGDHALGEPGQRTLDLLTSAPQPGLASTATAVDDPGFDESSVVLLEVQWAGSGALDDLAWCQHGVDAPRAAALVRNGSGANPVRLSSPGLPLVGGHWVARLDCTGPGSGLAGLIVTATAATVPTSAGELLVAGPRLLRMFRPNGGGAVDFAVRVPADPGLRGVTVCAQGICFQGGAATLCNALDLTLGD